MTKKKPRDVDQLIREAGLYLPEGILRGLNTFPLETFQSPPLEPGAELSKGHVCALARAMADAPNPWMALGTPLARWILGNLWAQAKDGKIEAARTLKVFVEILSFDPWSGRRGLSSEVKKTRADVKQPLARLTNAILSGEISKLVPTPQAMTAAVEISKPHAVTVDLREIYTLSPEPIFKYLALLHGQGIDLKEVILLQPLTPIGDAAHLTEEARNRAGTFLAALFTELEKVPDPYGFSQNAAAPWTAAAQYVLRKWWPGSTPGGEKLPTGDAIRKRIARSK
jgi:hypothetical protein